MKARVALLAITALYGTHQLRDFAWWLLLLLSMYEIGYYSLRKEKVLLDWGDAMRRYKKDVKALSRKGA